MYFIDFNLKPHLGKCFGNIKYLEIGQNPPTIKTMISSEGERVAMPKYVDCSITCLFYHEFCCRIG